jgi:hypothetical protein
LKDFFFFEVGGFVREGLFLAGVFAEEGFLVGVYPDEG